MYTVYTVRARKHLKYHTELNNTKARQLYMLTNLIDP